jgi:accessory colonization factor AcfC
MARMSVTFHHLPVPNGEVVYEEHAMRLANGQLTNPMRKNARLFTPEQGRSGKPLNPDELDAYIDTIGEG